MQSTVPRLSQIFDPMVRLLLLAILLASVLPATGDGRAAAQLVSNTAIFVLFLLNGLRLPRSDVAAGVKNWHFLLPLALWCFGAMALVGWGLSVAISGYLPTQIALGFLFLGVLPSTVQSAIAYASLANGNAVNSVIAAALLSVLGFFVSAPLFAVIAGNGEVQLGFDGLARIFAILILPFALGQIMQPRLGPFVARHPKLVRWMDRIAIALAVYVAFSGAVEQGLWGGVSVDDWGLVIAALFLFLVIGFGGAWSLSGLLRFGRADRISFTFAGAHKSVALGAPLALVLFPPEIAGPILVPLLAYHLLQLIVSAPLATRFARGAG